MTYFTVIYLKAVNAVKQCKTLIWDKAKKTFR